MKEYTIKFSLRQLLALILGVPLFIATVSFTFNNDSDEFNARITLEQAKSLYSNNNGSETPFGGSIKAFSMTTDMLNALNAVSTNVDGEFGYRCYFGMDENASPVSVIVAIDDRSADLTTYIESGEASLFDACPTACDLASPITSE